MTNGEKLKEIFPSMPINVSEDTVYCGKSKAYIGEFSKDWWNEEYKEPTTKNDVTDNNVSNIYKCSCGYGWDESKVFRHHFCPNCGKAVDSTTKNDLVVDCISRDDVRDVMQGLWGTSGELMDRLMALPSVTPQEPRKGHWIEVLGGCKCSRCDMAFSKLKETCADNYCPNCGSDNREVEE